MNNPRQKANDPVSTSVRPEWLRVPQAVQIYGIGKSSLYDLIARGKIRSALVRSSRSVKQTGTKHGSRLLSAASIEAYISSFATGGIEESPRSKKNSVVRR